MNESGKEWFKRKIDFTKILLFLLILAEYRFFFIPLPLAISKANTYHNKTIEIIIVIMLILVGRFRIRKLKFNKTVLLFAILITIDTIASLFRYGNEDKMAVLIPASTYLLIFLYYPLSTFLKNGHNLDYFLNTFQICNIIACIVTIAQSILYALNHKVFLHIYEYIMSPTTIESVSRNALLRNTYISTPVSIALIFSLTDLLVYKRNTKLNAISSFLGICYFVISSQTRMYIAICILLIIYIFYFLRNQENKRSIVERTLTLTFVFIVVAWALKIPEMISDIVSPIIDGSYLINGSYFARLDAIRYFSEAIFKHPIFGLGIIRVEKGSIYYNIIRGTSGYAVYTDVGLLGSIAEFGLPLIILLITLFVRMRRISRRPNNIVSHYEKVYLLFMILSCITLSVLDPQRVIIIPIALSLFDCTLNNEVSLRMNLHFRGITKNMGFKLKKEF